mgnify:CR=1 FL=1
MKFHKLLMMGRVFGSGGGSNSGSVNGKVQEVTTADELDTILENATEKDVGRGFLYLGETTETYKFECVYIIREG